MRQPRLCRKPSGDSRAPLRRQGKEHALLLFLIFLFLLLPCRVTISSADFALSSSNNSEALMLLQKITEDNPSVPPTWTWLSQLKTSSSPSQLLYPITRENGGDLLAPLWGQPQVHLLLPGSCGKATWATHSHIAGRRIPQCARGVDFFLLCNSVMSSVSLPQPELALSVFEKALRKNSRDAVLASKVGQVLVRTHQYAKVQSSPPPIPPSPLSFLSSLFSLFTSSLFFPSLPLLPLPLLPLTSHH